MVVRASLYRSRIVLCVCKKEMLMCMYVCAYIRVGHAGVSVVG